MKLITSIFQDKTVNDLLVAIIIGFSTVLFFTNVVALLTQEAGRSITNPGVIESLPWREILDQLAGYIVCLLVALLIRLALGAQKKR
jgi:hypothetical protein